MAWWSEWREVYFSLMTLACPLNLWEESSGYKRIYSDGNFSFRESEIKGNFDEVEEQLWAFRNGLSSMVLEIRITRKAARRNLKKLMRGK